MWKHIIHLFWHLQSKRNSSIYILHIGLLNWQGKFDFKSVKWHFSIPGTLFHEYSTVGGCCPHPLLWVRLPGYLTSSEITPKSYDSLDAPGCLVWGESTLHNGRCSPSRRPAPRDGMGAWFTTSMRGKTGWKMHLNILSTWLQIKHFSSGQ